MIAASAPIDPVFRMDENLKHQDASMEDDSEQFLGTNGENEIVPDQQISHEAASNPNKLSSLDVIKVLLWFTSHKSSFLFLTVVFCLVGGRVSIYIIVYT